MLYAYTGNDQVAVRTKANARLSELEEGGATVERYDVDIYEKGMIASLAGGTSLFGGRRVVVFEGFSSDEDAQNELLEALELLSESDDSFIVLDNKILPTFAKELKKNAKEFLEIKDDTIRFNTFALADALANKDKKTLWLLLIRSRVAGVSPEEVAGTLFWQLKSLRLAKITKNGEEAGMKEFPYNKAKRASAKFRTDELQTLSHSLISLYHKGHLGLTDLDLALERWVLRV